MGVKISSDTILRLKRYRKAGADAGWRDVRKLLRLWMSRLRPVRLPAGCVEGWIAPSGEPFDASPAACGVCGRMDCAFG